MPPTLSNDTGTDSRALAILAAAAAIVLGYALQLTGGNYHPTALAWLTVAIALSVLALLLRGRALSSGQAFMAVVGAGLVLQLRELVTRPPGVYLTVRQWGDFRPFFLLVATMTVVAASGLSNGARFARWRMPILLAAYLAAGAWVIRYSPVPGIDTWSIHQQACAALAHGVNPYAIKLHDIYGSHSPYFAPGVSVGGVLQHGYPYPPLSLLIAYPGYALLGDHRYGNLLCASLAGAFMGYARPGARATLAAALFLLTPRGFQVIEDSWTEPYVLAPLAATVFCACRCPRWIPVPLGLFLAAKQYTPIALPATLLLLPPGPFKLKLKSAVRMYGLAAIVAVAVTLPFFLWNPAAFVWSAIRIPMMGPYRPDSLGYLPLFSKTGPVSQVPSLLFLLAAYAAILWRAPRTPAGFAVAVAVTTLGFFSLSKQAFLNYYFLVTGALFCGVAAACIPGSGKEVAAGDEPKGGQ